MWRFVVLLVVLTVASGNEDISSVGYPEQIAILQEQVQTLRDALAGVIVIMRTQLANPGVVDRATLNFHQKYPNSPAQKMYEFDIALKEAQRRLEAEEALARARAFWDEICSHDTPPSNIEETVFWYYCKGLVEYEGKLTPANEVPTEVLDEISSM